MKAQSLFATLKKKYQRKKKNLHDCNRFGTPSDLAAKARKAYQSYFFLTWLDDFYEIRSGRSSIPAESTDARQDLPNEELSEEAKEVTKMEIFYDEDENADTDDESQPVSKTSKQGKATEMDQITQQETLIDNTIELSQIKEISHKIPDRTDDKEELFARSVSADLRDLPPFERMMAKNEIQNILFKYEMYAYKKQNPAYDMPEVVPQPNLNLTDRVL